MFENEYKLTEKEANLVFDIFDKDYNGELSYWEYKQFYLTVGEK
jgi:Ca2+-binding EF-hand superfamily protein